MEDGFIIAHESHLFHPLTAGIKQAVGFDQVTNAVKSDFSLEVFRVYQISLFCPPKVIKKAASV
jgi:hypothetical protein